MVWVPRVHNRPAASHWWTHNYSGVKHWLHRKFKKKDYKIYHIADKETVLNEILFILCYDI